MSKEKGKLNNISRRDLLKGGSTALAAFTGLQPAARLMELMVKDLAVKKTYAAQDDAPSLFYMPIFLFGAPARWCFDQMLATKESDLSKILTNQMVATSLSSSNGVNNAAVYRTFDYKGVQVPLLWNYEAQTSEGTKSLKSLLDHLIVFRGYGSGADGHTNNSSLQLSPVPSSGSVSGVIGDQAKSLFRVIQSIGFPYTGYNSPNGNGLTIVNYNPNENLVLSLLKSFRKNPDTRNLASLKDKYKTNYEDTRLVFKKLSKASLAPGDSLGIDYQKALQKIESSIEDLSSVWQQLFGKYQTLLLNAYKNRTQGITSLPVQVQSDPGTEVNPWAVQSFTETIFPQVGTDLRDTVNNVNVDHMAAEFALAEYIATRRISAAFEMVLTRGADNIAVSTQRTLEGGNLTGIQQRSFSTVFDQHSTGSISTVFYNTLFFQGLAACVLELVQVLKSQNLFSSSYIQFVSEFGRTPRNTQGGSDHGFDNMISSLITGVHNSKPIIVGNILRDGSGGIINGTYSGTFGYKSSTNVNGKNLMLGPASVTSTLANLMKLPSNPWKNVADPLVELNSGQLNIKASGEIV